MVEAGGVHEDSGAALVLHAVCLEDGEECRFVADARVVLFLDALPFGFVGARANGAGPVLGVLAVVRVEGEVLGFVFG